MERGIIGAMRTAFESSAERIVAAEEYALILKKEIEKLRAQLPRWIPVTERLPEYDARVREKDPDDGNDCWFDSAGWWYAFDEITHWMPLPKGPEVE